MPRIKRERSEEPDAPSRRVRGRNRVGGDLASLLKLHALTPRGIPDGTGRSAEISSVIVEAANWVYPAPSKLADVAWSPSQAPASQENTHAPISLDVESERVSLAPLTGVTLATYSDGSVRVLRVPEVPAPSHVEADEALCDIVVVDTVAREVLAQAPVHDTLVTAVSWQRLPPVNTDGVPDVQAQPTTLLSVGLDGTEVVSDTAAMFSPYRLAHTREPRYAAAWAPYGGLWVVDFGDSHFGSVSLRTHDAGQHHALGFHHGRILAIATSDVHPFVATGASDGSVKLTNLLAAGKRKAEDGSRVMHKLFRLQRQADGTYKMRHAFFPEGVWPQHASKHAPPSWDTWDPSVAVTAVAFGPAPGQALSLASGTAVGLVRIESL
ncbi:hypothetical protein MBRA1_002596 [Malassezia brasiliensis]|uniref:Uncharacterized protein n=1 Tax=Malassezia brasiliensis TaxID=1821822 RepID=A0AAF0IQB8_9BASI|nr:hypothetical protein MBRA1_002596 [Malassezia brasiliensis]